MAFFWKFFKILIDSFSKVSKKIYLERSHDKYFKTLFCILGFVTIVIISIFVFKGILKFCIYKFFGNFFLKY